MRMGYKRNKNSQRCYLLLISLDKSDTTFVTKEIIETEKAIMDLVDKGKTNKFEINLNNRANNANKSIDSDSMASGSMLSEKNKKNAIDVLQSKQRLHLVENYKADNKD